LFVGKKLLLQLSEDLFLGGSDSEVVLCLRAQSMCVLFRFLAAAKSPQKRFGISATYRREPWNDIRAKVTFLFFEQSFLCRVRAHSKWNKHSAVV